MATGRTARLRPRSPTTSQRPGLDLRKAFGYVRDDVQATNNRQEPFIYGSLGGDDMVLVPAPAPVVAAPPPAAFDPNEPVRRDYGLAERVGTKEAWDFFLATYPKGFYSKLAQLQRDTLAAEDKARATAEEQARLAVEGARATEQAKAAEDAKLAVERTKTAKENKAARERAAAEKAASQAKAADDARLAEKATQERIAKAQAEADAAAAKAKAAEDERAAQEARAAELQKAIEAAKATGAEKRAKAAALARPIADGKVQDGKIAGDKPLTIASLSPADKPGDSKPAADDIPRLLQRELRRVSCLRRGPRASRARLPADVRPWLQGERRHLH